MSYVQLYPVENYYDVEPVVVQVNYYDRDFVYIDQYPSVVEVKYVEEIISQRYYSQDIDVTITGSVSHVRKAIDNLNYCANKNRKFSGGVLKDGKNYVKSGVVFLDKDNENFILKLHPDGMYGVFEGTIDDTIKSLDINAQSVLKKTCDGVFDTPNCDMGNDNKHVDINISGDDYMRCYVINLVGLGLSVDKIINEINGKKTKDGKEYLIKVSADNICKITDSGKKCNSSSIGVGTHGTKIINIDGMKVLCEICKGKIDLNSYPETGIKLTQKKLKTRNNYYGYGYDYGYYYDGYNEYRYEPKFVEFVETLPRVVLFPSYLFNDEIGFQLVQEY